MSRILDDIYSSLPCGSDASASDRLAVDKLCGEGAATYGEIHPRGARKLLQWLKLTDRDCLVDCGSGTGRLILQSVLGTGVGEALGIEVSDFRHQIAVLAKAGLRERLGDKIDLSRARFELGDFRDLMPPNASVLYAGSLCFPPKLMTALAALVCNLPRFRALCTLKRLPAGWAGQIAELGEVDLEMTWSKNNRLYIYGPKHR